MARFGSIGTQYFDDAGDPLSGGTLTFYESGTTTPKDTFSDLELTIPNTNPVVLDAAGRQPNIFFNGAAKCVLKDAAGVQIEVRDPVGDAVSRVAFAQWNALIYYQIGDIVEYGGLYYRSLINANINNQPDSSTTEWELFTLIPVDDTGAEVLEAIGSVRLTAADQYYYTTADNAFAAGTITAFGRSLVDDADAAAARTTLGGTTVGQAFFTVPDPSAISFPRVNADNSVSLLDQGDFLNAIGSPAFNQQEFTASGTWDKPAGAKFVLVELWGAGGGGGGGHDGSEGGAGGAGGRYAWALFRASDLSSSVAVVIGAGGTGGVNGSSVGQSGSTGGSTTFGGHLVAFGGHGGSGGSGPGVGPSSGGRISAPMTGSPLVTADLTEMDRLYAGVGGDSGTAGGRSLYGGGGGGGGGDSVYTGEQGGGAIDASGSLTGGGGAANGGAGDPFQGGGGGNENSPGGDGGTAGGGGGGGANRPGGSGGDGYARITTW